MHEGFEDEWEDVKSPIIKQEEEEEEEEVSLLRTVNVVRIHCWHRSITPAGFQSSDDEEAIETPQESVRLFLCVALLLLCNHGFL